VTLNVDLNGAAIRDFRFYVTEHGMSIMGVDLFDAFGGSVLLGGDRVASWVVTVSPAAVCRQRRPESLSASLQSTQRDLLCR